MTNDDRRTEYARYAATPKGAIELAAAAATAEVSRLFQQFSKLSQRKQRDVAELLGVSESRVSQVLTGDGNVKIAALVKYARAYGYRVSFVLSPAEPGVQELPQATPRRPRRRPVESIVDSSAAASVEPIHVNARTRSNQFVSAVARSQANGDWALVSRYKP